jgi:hypothetical protein
VKFSFIINYILGVNIMSNAKRDIIIGLMFITGIAGFISGEFIFSSVFFASAATYTNLLLSRRTKG